MKSKLSTGKRILSTSARGKHAAWLVVPMLSLTHKIK